MKSSIHLFYGIIIGVLATLCMGLNKEEAKQFKEQQIVEFQEDLEDGQHGNLFNKAYPGLLRQGWVAIDWQLDPEDRRPGRKPSYFVRLGR